MPRSAEVTTGRAYFPPAKSAERETPATLFAALDAEFGFTLDAAASAENAKCICYYTAAEDALQQPWGPHRVWLNPPYGVLLGRWTRKARDEAARGALVVMLLPARTDTRWFHEDCLDQEVRFLRGRLQFGGTTGSAPFPSMLVIFRPSVQT